MASNIRVNSNPTGNIHINANDERPRYAGYTITAERSQTEHGTLITAEDWRGITESMVYDGVGIETLVYNDDFTVTITLMDGRTFTTEDTIAHGVDQAESAAEHALDAMRAVQNMGVSASTLEEGSSATVTKSVDQVTGTVDLAFGIPKGDKGDKGETGETGATPDFSIGTVTTGNVGSDASATITGTAENPVLNLSLPRGATGDVTNIAPTFSSSMAYSAGDHVIYNDLLYEFKADHAAGVWIGTDASQVKVGSELTDLKSELNYINDGELSKHYKQIFANTIYGSGGTVGPYKNYKCAVYELIPSVTYTVKAANMDSILFGLSNYLYEGTLMYVGKTYNDNDSNTITFKNKDAYKYLYITQGDNLTDRGISVVVSLHDVVVDNNIQPITDTHFNSLEPYNLGNGYVNSTNGNVVSTASFKSTDYIDIQGHKKAVGLLPTLTSSVSGAGTAFYDSSKNYISGVPFKVDASGISTICVVPIPDNAVYLRTSCRTTEADYFYIIIDDVEANTLGISALESDVENINFDMRFGAQLFEKIGVIGDSISVGWAKDKNGNNSRRNTSISWVQQMARRLGCTAYNLGASGVDPIEWFQTNYEFYEYCYPQYQSVGVCDLYIIGLGLNQGTLGSTSDINQSDYTQNGTTFYGQYARIIQMINAEHPNAIVMCLTEPTTAISSYDQAVRDICALNFINAELVDLENDYFDLFNTPEILAQHQPDGLHFTPYGYSLLADAMIVALNDYISKNTSKFKYVGVATV